MAYVLGLDIGGTSTKVCVISEEQASSLNVQDVPLLYKSRVDYPLGLNLSAYKGVIRNELDIINREYLITKIGVAFPGVLNSESRVISSPNLDFFVGEDIKSLMAEVSGLDKKVIFIDNDANIACFCESLSLKSAGDNIEQVDKDNFIFLTLGTGIGCGIFLESNLYRGVNGGAGEFGHSFFSPGSIDELFNLFDNNDLDDLLRKDVLSRFTIEAYIGSNNFIAYLHRNYAGYEFNYVSFSDFIKAVVNKEKKSEIALKVYVYFLAISAASLLNIFDIRHLVIGGGGSIIYDFLEPLVMKVLKLRLLPHLNNNFVLSKSHLGNMSGSLGAAIFTQVTK